jgi:DNA-binding phage protein
MPGLIDPNWKGNALDASPVGKIATFRSFSQLIRKSNISTMTLYKN